MSTRHLSIALVLLRTTKRVAFGAARGRQSSINSRTWGWTIGAPSSRGAAAAMTWSSMPTSSLDSATRALLQSGLGGVVLFAQNVVDPPQLRRLTADIRRAASRSVRIAIDHEGGHVSRIREPLTQFPSLMAIGATRSAELALRVARAQAGELRWLGIDTVLGPDLDLAIAPWNPVLGARCLTSSPTLGKRLGAALVRGYLDGGVLPAAKHVPGHGRCKVDSHLAAGVVADDEETLLATDIAPFRAAVDAGVPLLMTSHTV